MELGFSTEFYKACETLAKVFKEAIEKTEIDLGRPLTEAEKELCVKIGVPFALLRVLGKEKESERSLVDG